jgi:PAS domain S-box-containing protein
MGKPLRVLMVEDSEDDVLLTVRALKKGGYDPAYERVETAGAMRTALREKTWDIIVCDYQMPQFNGLAAIALLKETGIDIPLIIVSGAIGEETAADCMRYGAHDYIMKGNLARLVPAIERELQEAESRSKRRQAEGALRESEQKYHWIVDNMADVITVMDMNLRFTYVSPSIMRMRGYTPEEAVVQTFEQVMTPESLQIIAKVFEEEMNLEAGGTADPGRSRILDLNEYRKDGSIVCMENHLSFLRDEAQKAVGIISLTRDITERKRAEGALRESEELFRSYLENAPDGVYMNDLEGNFLYGNRKCEEITGYRREEVIGKNFLELNLLPEKSLNKADKLLQDNMEGRSTGPDEVDLIRKDGRLIPVEINTNVVQRMGQRVVLSFARDITERKQAEEELQRTLEKLRSAIQTTISVMVSAVESRDPYTAGHQVRSANLASAIATEMGLPREQIDGIQMAGSIHDIGKLSIPAEILSKPKKLTSIELSIVKEHSLKGFEMLRDVESPWPLAQIVYQHHERMDGSGYPGNLKGDQILLEARIMAVADVVEAMASHRPYRPSLGMDAALEEIENNKGKLYDAGAADACLRLFREKGFRLEGA